MTNSRSNFISIIIISFLALGITPFLTSCEEAKEPEFIGIENAKLSDVKDGNLIISADLKYFNPNIAGGTVEAVDIDVVANDVSLGKAVQTGEVEIKGNENFKIPLLLSVPATDLLSSQSGLLGGILDAFVNKKIKVNFKGTTTLKVLGINFDHDIDYEESLNL